MDQKIFLAVRFFFLLLHFFASRKNGPENEEVPYLVKFLTRGRFLLRLRSVVTSQLAGHPNPRRTSNLGTAARCCRSLPSSSSVALASERETLIRELHSTFVFRCFVGISICFRTVFRRDCEVNYS